MDSDSEFEDCPTKLTQVVSEDLETKYGIEFNFDKNLCNSILEQIVRKDKLKFSCIAGGFFTKFNGQLTTPDIYIYIGRNNVPSEDFLNGFINENFKIIRFEQLGTVAPQGILARKKIKLLNGMNANINFSYINFPKSDNHKIQLLNTYDLEPCKIIYSYSKNSFDCSDWFNFGGNMISEDHDPTDEFIEKYRQKGFRFENDHFKLEKKHSVISINL